MNLNKKQREILRNKFGGKCAYCGMILGKTWHKDHMNPVEREIEWESGKGSFYTGKLCRPENDTLENLMPSCPPCNISKGKMTIENWRDWLTGHMKSLNNNYSIYRIMLAFGCIVETGKSIVFYFETINKDDEPNE